QDQLLFGPFRDADRTDLAHVLDRDLLDRPGQGEVEAGVEGMRILAERGHDPLLARGDLVHAAHADPQQGDRGDPDRVPALAAGALGRAEGRPARAPAPHAARAFGAAVLEDVLDAGRTARPFLRRAAGQPGIAWAARPFFGGRRRSAVFRPIAAGTLVAGRLAPRAALARHRQCDPLVKP